MDIEIAPSARDEVDVLEIAEELCNNDFYKDDYENRTKGLISDDVSYEEVRDFFRQLMERVF